MKKLLFISALIISNIISANIATYVYLSSDTGTVGDSAWVGFKCVQSLPALHDTSYIYVYDVNNSCPQPTLIFKMNYNDLHNLKKVWRASTNDSIYKAYFIVPNLCKIGKCFLLALNTTPFFIKANTTGIEEYYTNDILLGVEYYNLFGQQIERTNELCIERKIFKSGKVLQRKVMQVL